jgi:hypothetical protein
MRRFVGRRESDRQLIMFLVGLGITFIVLFVMLA